MRLHRFFGNFDFKHGRVSISDSELVGQWRDVLRFKVGDEIILCDGKMSEALARIVSFEKKSAEAEILRMSKNQNEPEVAVILYCSILKREHFELVVEKATEVGVKEITPIICGRTVKTNIRRERLEKIIKEAAEQSGRGIVPILRDPEYFSKAVGDACAYGANFFFDAGGVKIENFKIGALNSKNAGVFIGPEGGWTEQEIVAARANGFHLASLGTTTLRAETAAIVAVYSVLGVL